MFRIPAAVLPPVLLLLVVGCDNVGRAFDPVVEPDQTPTTPGESAVQVVPVGGDAREGRPKVRAAFPSGGGWPTTVPVVVEFTESVNEASIVPTTETGTDGRVVLRVRGTNQPLPCQYDFVANGRVLVMRPLTTLSNAQVPTYEVVLLPEARDVDGVRFVVEGDSLLLTDFQVNQEATFTDGRILTTFPRDNATDAARETEYFLFFDRPANATSIQPTNLRIRLRGGADVAGDRDAPVSVLGVGDRRVVRFTPADPLLASSTFELVVDDTITFGQGGKLDFRGRTPFAQFKTVGPAAPASVVLDNPILGFPDKINRANVSNVALSVTTAGDAEAGDRIRARIYGGDAATTASGDLAFVERTVEVAANGSQTVTLDFSGLLGTVDRPKFDDGEISFAAQSQRGSQSSGFVQNAANAEPIFDITPPSLRRAGPPTSIAVTDILTDQEYVTFFGTATEGLAAASLVDGVNPPAPLFGSADDGRFVMLPLALGRLVAPRPYSLTLTDRAGNLSATAASGNIVQRGLVTGTVAGDLTVEVYDHATLLPIAGATVLVDPGLPVVPAVGQRVGTTGANGRVSFAGLLDAQHTVTVVRAGFHLLTLYATGSAFVSLPLRSTTAANATATLQGNVLFQQAAGTTVLVGSSAFDDPGLLAVRTADASPTAIPATPIVPNRPAIVTALGGVFEPTDTPTFSLQGVQMLGPTLTTQVPPVGPATAGSTENQALALLPSAGLFGGLLGVWDVDFGAAVGLDTGNLVGGAPIVRMTASMHGFGGQVLAGAGFATLISGAAYEMTANFSIPVVAGLAAYGPVTWIVAEARDQGGRICRHRGSVQTPTGTILDLGLTPAPIPSITAPTAASNGSPAVTFADVFDPAAVPGGIVIDEVTAVDPTGRRWVLMSVDTDAVGGTETVQFPDLASAGVVGLAPGTWSVRAEARLLLSLALGTGNDLVLAERQRSEISFTRSAAVDFTIQ